MSWQDLTWANLKLRLSWAELNWAEMSNLNSKPDLCYFQSQKDYQARDDKFFQQKTVTHMKTQNNWQIDKFSSLLPQQQQHQFKKLGARCSRLKIIIILGYSKNIDKTVLKEHQKGEVKICQKNKSHKKYLCTPSFGSQIFSCQLYCFFIMLDGARLNSFPLWCQNMAICKTLD